MTEESLEKSKISNTVCSLADKSCVPCRGGVPALKGEALQELAAKAPDWQVVEGHHLRRVWKFKNFVEALAFVNRVGALAEEQGHHPTIELSWGRVAVTLHTHKIEGLSESDFILAAKIDTL
jgi:4a-hydroxytetrahydrobiopterin dehydratase